MSDLDGTAVEVGAELAPVEHVNVNLFRTDDPVEVLSRATVAAEALYAKLVEGGLIMQIGPSKHVKVEGWLMLGTMLGVTPVVAWTRKLENGWEARCEAQTMDGRIVGAGEAECLNTEHNWKNSDDFQIRSMAQTRATAKALSGPLRFVVALAGLSGTPAEEMVGVNTSAPGKASGKPSEGQVKFLKGLVTRHKVGKAQLRVMLDQVGAQDVEIAEGWMGRLTAGREGTASALIDWFQSRPLPDADHPSDVPADGFEPPLEGDTNDAGVPFR